jgi:hypothetical protein
MERESLKGLLRRRPFKPFRLFVSDGAAYEVRHPDLCMLAKTEAVIGLPPHPASIDADRFAWIDLDHVTRVEPLDVPTPAGE